MLHHNNAMRLLITHAHTSSVTPIPEALSAHLKLPHLKRLISSLGKGHINTSDVLSFTMPHEQVLANWLGLPPFAEESFPAAALHRCADGLSLNGEFWMELTPAHWDVGLDQLSMDIPEMLALTEEESRALYLDVAALLAASGWQCQWGTPLRWYASHPTFADLALANIDRAIGQDVDEWLPEDSPQAKALRRLQNEIQMLLFHHPVNSARKTAEKPIVNSVWFSGNGKLPAAWHMPDDVVLEQSLRLPALAGDGPGWLEAWNAIDSGPVSAALTAFEHGDKITLALCGERAAWQWLGRKNWTTPLKRLYTTMPDAVSILSAL